ncbi:MAG: ACP S-malonyltransferase, partial [Actinobacteria bacterium]|nr:ACP S-malonyltransferase [Actinomycetota bacterium]
MIAVLAPGQGAQSPGMLGPWLELPGVGDELGELSDAAGLDLRRLGTTADAEEIKDTAVTQPLLVALGVIAASRLTLGPAYLAAGHSVGELTAAAVAGALSAREAVAFAARRGSEMAAACALSPTGMSAILGGDPDAVSEHILAAGLTPANRNGAGQIVAAGDLERLSALTENPPPGARVRPLPVAGAFHTTYMQPAEAGLRAFAATLQAKDPARPLLSNADGALVTDSADLIERLVRQVTSPVRWDLCQHQLVELGVTAAIELAPGGTLAGLAKREIPGVTVVAIKA